MLRTRPPRQARGSGPWIWGAETLLQDLEEKPGVARLTRTTAHRAARGRGVGAAMLRHLIADARVHGILRLSLETGAMDYFRAARALYARHGFEECAPFGDYVVDRNSVFMTRAVE